MTLYQVRMAEDGVGGISGREAMNAPRETETTVDWHDGFRLTTNLVGISDLNEQPTPGMIDVKSRAKLRRNHIHKSVPCQGVWLPSDIFWGWQRLVEGKGARTLLTPVASFVITRSDLVVVAEGGSFGHAPKQAKYIWSEEKRGQHANNHNRNDKSGQAS